MIQLERTMAESRPDLVVRNVRIGGSGAITDLAISDGHFCRFTADSDLSAATVIDGDGKMAIPGFVEPHIHLDKALIRDDVRVNESGSLEEAIEIIWDRKRDYTIDDIVGRAGRVIRSAVAHGITHMRTHVDVDTIGGLRPLEGVLRARQEYRDVMDIEIVAFPQEGILKSPGTESLLHEAMQLGANVVGGMPFNEAGPEESREHIRIAFDLAERFDADVDMHVDESDDPNARTLEMLARATIERGWQGRVTAGHTCALAAYPDDYAERMIDLVREAGVNMIVNPATNLMLQGRQDHQPKRRGITRVKELLAAGVNVSCGQDCVKDTFYPFGRCSPLEVALLLAHAAHLSQPGEVDEVFSMITTRAEKVMRLEHRNTQPGSQADLVILDASSAQEALTQQAECLHVIKSGRVVSETRKTTKLNF